MTRVVAAMWTGLVLTVAAAVYPFVDTHLLADHIRAGYPAYQQPRIDSAVSTYLVLLAGVAALGVLAWLGTVWAVRAGKRWARPLATALFVVGTSVGLIGLLTRDTSGGTGLPPVLGWAGVAPCLAGVVVVLLLWRRRAQSSMAR
jgi:hypothetical protein